MFERHHQFRSGLSAIPNAIWKSSNSAEHGSPGSAFVSKHNQAGIGISGIVHRSPQGHLEPLSGNAQFH